VHVYCVWTTLYVKIALQDSVLEQHAQLCAPGVSGAVAETSDLQFALVSEAAPV